MASLAQSSIGGPAERIVSAPVLSGLVRVGDFGLFLVAAFLAAAGVAAWFDAPFWHEAPLRGAAALAAAIGAATGCAVLDSAGAYAIDRLGAPRAQIGLTLKAVIPAAAAAIACLFLANADTPPLRAFPFAFGASALVLEGGFRLFLRALIHRWRKTGRFRRRIAVVAASDFAREFIERLRIRRYRRHCRLRRGGRPASRRSSRLTGSQPLQPLRRPPPLPRLRRAGAHPKRRGGG